MFLTVPRLLVEYLLAERHLDDAMFGRHRGSEKEGERETEKEGEIVRKRERGRLRKRER
jgi:hypothetical protein